jgi:hypothetical protein
MTEADAPERSLEKPRTPQRVRISRGRGVEL